MPIPRLRIQITSLATRAEAQPAEQEARINGYVHPVGIQIVRILARQPRTVTSVARELGVHPANLTHHFKLLQRLG